MTYPQTPDIYPVPIPIKGMNTRDPAISLDPMYGAFVRGMEPEPQYLSLSHGFVREHVNTCGAGTKNVLALGAHGGTGFYYYTASTSTEVGIALLSSGASVRSTTGTAVTQVDVVKYAGVTMFIGAGASTSFGIDNAGNYVTWAWTSGGASIFGRVVTSYKGRVYIFNGLTMYYSALAGVTGATTSVDLTTLIDEYSDGVTWASAITGPTNQQDSTWLAFGTRSGQIFVYAGDNPGASNWEQIGQFKTSRSLGYNSCLQHNNDVWVATENNIISIRNLFLYGSDDVEKISVTSAIDPSWIKMTTNAMALNGIDRASVSLVSVPSRNKIYVLCMGGALEDGTMDPYPSISVYNTISKAWTIRALWGVNANFETLDLIFLDTLYFVNYNTIVAQDTGFVDEVLISDPGDPTYAGVSFDIFSSYHDYGTGRRKRVVSLEPIFETDLQGAYVEVNLASDFGKKSSARTSVALATTTSLQSPTYTVGISGKHIQYRIRGQGVAASSTGFNLYAMGVAII